MSSLSNRLSPASAGITKTGIAIFAVGMVAVVGFQVFAVTQLPRDVELVLVLLLFGLIAPRRWAAAAIGFAAVANLDAIPLIQIVGGQRRSMQTACLAICIGLLVRSGEQPRLRPKGIRVWSIVMAAVMVIGIVRPAYFGIARTIENSLDVSMPTLVLVVGAPILAAALRPDGVWKTAAAVLFAAVTVNSLIRIGIYGLGDPQALIERFLHPTIIRSVSGDTYTGGTARVVSSVQHLVPWAWALSVGFAFVGPRKLRRPAAGVAALMTLALLLTYTRAFYIGAGISLLWALLFGLRSTANPLDRDRHSWLRSVALAALAVLTVLTVSGLVGGGFATRFLDIGGGDHNTEVRAQALSVLLGYMRGVPIWLFGRGYQSPLDFYDPTLESVNGMYSTDLGMLAVLMPVGLIGVVGIIGGTIALIRANSQVLRRLSVIDLPEVTVISPVMLGTSIFCVFFIAVALTVYLPMDGAYLATALAFAIGLNAITDGDHLVEVHGSEATLQPTVSPDGEFQGSGPEPDQIAREATR